MIGGCVLACLAPQACSGVGLAIEACVLGDIAETVTGLGDPADVVPEYIPEEGLLR